MIITQTPFRMSFFGGGTDFKEFYHTHGGCVLSTTIDKYCYVNVRRLPRFFEYATEVVYSKIERVSSRDDIRHPAVREAMKYVGLSDLRVSYEADLPARTGLGTSSSFAVGLLSAFYALQGQYASKNKLADEAIYLERVLCGESGGEQDQIAASFGGLNRIDFAPDGYKVNPVIITPDRKKRLNDNLMLFFTGFSRNSFTIQKETIAHISDNTARLLEMKQLVDAAEAILTEEGDLDDFGRLLDHAWQLKRGTNTGISNDTIDRLYALAKNAGALGGKLLGAGGGGFLLFYVTKQAQPAVKKALKELLYVPFEFEKTGTSVLYFAPETAPDATR